MRGFRLPGNSGSPDMSLWKCFRSVQSREDPREVWDAPGTAQVHLSLLKEVWLLRSLLRLN